MPSGNGFAASRHSPMTQDLHVLGIDAGGTKTVCQLADDHGRGPRRSARRRRQPAGGRRARGREGPPRRDGGGDRRPRDHAGGDLPRHRRRRSAGRRRGGARDHAAHRLQGARARRQRRAGRARGRRARRSPASSSSPAPGRSPTAATRRTKRRAPAAGATCSATRAAATGSAAPRCARCCAKPITAGRKTALTPLLLQHFGVAQAQGLIHEVYHSNLKPSAIGALAQCVQAAFRDGDSAAIGILRGAADELEASGLSVARRLGLVGEPFTFILSGGIFRAVPVAARGARAPAAGRRAGQQHASCSTASRRPAPSRSRSRKRAAARVIPAYKRD